MQPRRPSFGPADVRGAGGLPWLVYADTSVFGGCFDPPFVDDSLRFFRHVLAGRIRLLLSSVVRDELQLAPARVRNILGDLSPTAILDVAVTGEAHALRDAYLTARVVGRRSMDDAMHVALATVTGAHALVSWNFKHMVRLDRIRGYNRINLESGYAPVTILNPSQLLSP